MTQALATPASDRPPAPYGRLSIGLHWFMLLLLAAVYATIELREVFPRGSAIREGLKTWHFMLGLSVFGLVGVRLIARIGAPHPSGPRAWTDRLAAVVHLALYAIMIAMPVLGWLALSADGKAAPFFGLQLPPLVGPNEALAEQVEEIHETVGTAGYWLVGLHTAAALFHHHVLRDGVLQRMLPRGS